MNGLRQLPAVLLLRRGLGRWRWLCCILGFLRHTLSHRYFRRALGRLPTSTWREIWFLSHGLLHRDFRGLHFQEFYHFNFFTGHKDDGNSR